MEPASLVVSSATGGATPFLHCSSPTHSLAGASEWAAGQKELLLFMWTVWASVQQGNTVCPLRLDSLALQLSQTAVPGRRRCPLGYGCACPSRPKRLQLLEFSERRFSAPGHSHSECGCSLTGDCLPLQLEQNLTLNQIFGRLGVEMSWEKRRK